jgi:hypothetical protein
MQVEPVNKADFKLGIRELQQVIVQHEHIAICWLITIHVMYLAALWFMLAHYK